LAYVTTDYMPLKMPIPGSREPAQIALLNENAQVIAGHTHGTGGGLPVAVLRSGLSSSRPAPSQAGSFWFSTDTLLASVSNGTVWSDFVTTDSVGVTLTDPIVRDSIRFGAEGVGAVDTVLQRAGSNSLVLGGSPVLTQALGDARYKPIGYTPPPVDLSPYYTKAESDSRFVNAAGDQVTGNLDVSGVLSVLSQPVLTKAQADTLYDPLGSGGGGGGDAAYVHIQSTATVLWTVAHNLGKYPAVSVVDSAGSAIIPDIHYDSTAQVTLTFGSPTSGRVFCN
jgi:hypothetical protein